MAYPQECAVKSVRKRVISAAVMFGLATCVLSLPGRAQEPARRRSGPRDWSHGRIVAASAWGSDDPVVRRDWRTLRRHLSMEDAQARQSQLRAWLPWLRQGGLGRRPKNPGGTGSSGDVQLDWSLSTGGTGAVIGYPAKYSFDVTTSNCTDVIYYTVNHQGTATRPNVIAMTNPYAGCPGNPANLTPTVKFALRLPYGTGTSATLNLAGTVLYVVESQPTGGAILRAINVNNITTSPGTYNYLLNTWTSVHSLAGGTGTGAEQLFTINLGAANNLSSPFYDYDTNMLYVGDAIGRIHRIRNAHLPTAAEDTGWPISCGADQFQSPMEYNGQVLAGNIDGYIYRIDTTAATPTCIRAQRLGGGLATEGASGGITSPLLDVTNGKLLVTTGDTAIGENKALAVYNLTFAAGEAPISQVTIGTADGLQSQFPGLDNAFWTNNSGNVYAIGNGGVANTLLIRIPYAGSTLLPPVGYAQFRHTGGGASVSTTPVVEFLTAASVANPDFIFVGGNGTNYNYMNRISSGFGGTAAAPSNMAGFFATATGIGSGISVDTRTTSTTGTTATANIYFGTYGGSANSTIVQLAQQF
jgi:hypothetical protein